MIRHFLLVLQCLGYVEWDSAFTLNLPQSLRLKPMENDCTIHFNLPKRRVIAFIGRTDNGDYYSLILTLTVLHPRSLQRQFGFRSLSRL